MPNGTELSRFKKPSIGVLMIDLSFPFDFSVDSGSGFSNADASTTSVLTRAGDAVEISEAFEAPVNLLDDCADDIIRPLINLHKVSICAFLSSLEYLFKTIRCERNTQSTSCILHAQPTFNFVCGQEPRHVLRGL